MLILGGFQLMEEITFSNYNFLLVILSIITSIISSYTAFDLLSRARGSNGKKKIIWLISSGFILGIGMWSMHFIAMFSIKLPFPFEYRLVNIFLSLIVSIVFAFLSLLLVVRKNPFNYQFLISGILIVSGIHALHYIGMASMHVHYTMEYSNYISIIAILFSWLFSFLAYKELQLRDYKISLPVGCKIKSAIFMGAAISGAHYINQFSAKMIYFVDYNPYLFPVINPYLLGILMAVGTCLIVAFLLLTSSFDRKLARQSERIQLGEQYYKSLYEQNPDVILTFDLEGRFISANKAVSLFGYEVEELINKTFTPLVVPKDVEKAMGHFYQALNGDASTFECSIFDNQGNHREISVTDIPIYVNEKITGVYSIIKDITERIKTEKLIKHMAYHDQLTDLPNRYLLKETLENVINTSTKQKENFALLFLDLDRFKIVNDTMGHEIGDKLLMDLADRLKGCVKETDLIARLGGDEFAILLPNSTAERAKEVARRVTTTISIPFILNQHEILITPSIGISIFPYHGETRELLMKHADMAMYYAKSQGKNNYQTFSDNLIGVSKIDLEMNLRKALERNEFVLFYQPQINLHTNKIIGAESLIRWEHPERGIILPDEFIPLAEETGLIIQIGEWALLTACKQNKKWQEARLPPITVAVNISPQQFFQTDLAQNVKKCLVETGLDPKYLELEITESMTMDVDRSLITLLELKKIGVKISIDDFGTGYSSLHYLKKFPVDKLKIDRSFIRECTTDVNDETILKTIILMANLLKLQIIAEGVETKEQVTFLLEQMCTEAQGYFFSKPIPVEEFEANYYLIENHK
jgi:diguanylate cyclase